MFNIFINDLILRLENQCNIYNYADDNTLGCIATTYQDLYTSVRNASDVMLSWCKINYMQANPDKFQFIIFGKANATPLDLGTGIMLQPSSCVKVLGVFIDNMLTFKEHVAYINKKAGRSINALARVSRCLEYDSKICVLKAFVLSFYNYCPVVWHFVGMEDTKKIEKVQYRALKFVFNDFTSPYSILR